MTDPAKKNDAKRSQWPDFNGYPVVCIATGPSLTAEQIDYVHSQRIYDRCRVIAINEAGLAQYRPLCAPWADVLYAADETWWRHYRPEFYGYRISGGPVAQQNISINGKSTVLPAVKTQPIKCLDSNAEPPGEIDRVVSGGHSGFQALQLAIKFGGSRVILIGYDCGGPKRNCHDDRPEQFKRDTNMAAWVETYRKIPKWYPGVPVLNASIQSNIDAFQKVPLEVVL